MSTILFSFIIAETYDSEVKAKPVDEKLNKSVLLVSC